MAKETRRNKMLPVFLVFVVIWLAWSVVREMLKARYVHEHGFATISEFYTALMQPQHPRHAEAQAVNKGF